MLVIDEQRSPALSAPRPVSVRHEALKIAKKFNEFIPLPDRVNWKVRSVDVLHRGRPLTMLRTKRSFPFFDGISSLKSRSVTVTRQGFMVVYEESARGLIIDLRTATHVFCTADKFHGKKGEYTRCHVKVRLARGNIHLFVRDEEVHKWTNAIMQAVSLKHGNVALTKTTKDEGRRRRKTTKKNQATMVDAPEQKIERIRPIVKQEMPEDVDAKSLTPVTVIENNPEEEKSPLHDGPLSVRSLREKLEKQLLIRSKSEVLSDQTRLNRREVEQPSFISSLFLPYEPPSEDVILAEDVSGEVFTEERTVVLIPMGAAKGQEEEEEPKKGWWNRSLRC